jgi:hypothetical protein
LAPARTRGDQRRRLGGEIQLGVGRAEAVNAIVPDRRAERVAAALGPQRRIAGRDRIKVRIEDQRSETGIAPGRARDQVDLRGALVRRREQPRLDSRWRQNFARAKFRDFAGALRGDRANRDQAPAEIERALIHGGRR